MTTRRAFTLIELLVVIAIIGLISSIAVISTSNSREKARLAAGASFAAQLDRINGAASAGEWLFNEGTGTIATDASGGGSNGTLVNGPTWSSDTPTAGGSSLHLNGLNSYVQVNSTPALKYAGGGLTMALWIKPDPAGATGYLISKPWNGSGQYNYSLGYDGNLYINLCGATNWGSGAAVGVARNKWSFVAVTVDASKSVKLYVDGALRYSATHTISSWVPGSGDADVQLAIGTLYPYGSGWGGTAGFTFGGFIDDPRVFNDAFSAARIHKLYAKEKTAHIFDIAQR